MRLSLLLFIAISRAVQAHEESTITITNLTAAELYQGIQNGDFDVLVDVRSADEYTAGHIANATLMENLAVDGFPNASPDDLAGCESCRVAVYCRSGARAVVAATYLIDAGFHVLYNGGGTNQWTEAGYTLVAGTDSVVPPCTVDTAVSEQCSADIHSDGTNEDTGSEVSPAAAPSVEGSSSTNGTYMWGLSQFAFLAWGMMNLL